LAKKGQYDNQGDIAIDIIDVLRQFSELDQRNFSDKLISNGWKSTRFAKFFDEFQALIDIGPKCFKSESHPDIGQLTS
ncbi:hypothetical protein HDU92_007603, partial [Lobulomyces angularis]